MLSSEELGDQRRRSRATPNPWLIGLCFDAVIGSKSLLVICAALESKKKYFVKLSGY